MTRSQASIRFPVSCLLLALLPYSVSAQAPDPHFQFKGASTCKGCHSIPLFSAEFVSLNESTRWKNRDKHSMAVRLLVGMSRSTDGRIAIEPDKRENAIGLNMFAKLEVLSAKDLEEAVARGEELNPKLSDAQDRMQSALEAYLKARLAALTGADNADEIDALDSKVRDAEEEVKSIEHEYMQPLIDICLKSEIGRGCLSCHADLPKDGFSDKVDAASFAAESIRDGVSCEACHGPSSQWLDPHYRTDWRGKSPTDKVAMGLNDLRHPAVRANQCYSCHIGDVKQGKFIEHSWYMAGHPPLPSIEVETFAHDMPRHWRYLKEKTAFKKSADHAKFVAAVKGDKTNPFEIDSQFPQTKEVLVGGVVALRKSTALLADAHARDPKIIIPDFAAFDCQACHQELRSKPILTRDENKFDPYVPGRPNIPRWSFALADIAVDLSGGNRKAFEGAINDWRESLSRQPFGDRQQVGPAAEALAGIMKSLETKISQDETTAERAKETQAALTKILTNELLDFHSARQLVWALQVVANETGEAIPAGLKYPAEKDELSSIGTYLQIRLPAGATTLITDDKNLPQLLARIDAYDPEKFRSLMQEILAKP